MTAVAADQNADLTELFAEADQDYEQAQRVTDYLDITGGDKELAELLIAAPDHRPATYKKPSKYKQRPQQQQQQQQQQRQQQQPDAPARPKHPRITFKNLPTANGVKRNLVIAFGEEAAAPAPGPKGIPWTAEQDAEAERAAAAFQARLAEQERAEQAAEERARQRSIREVPRQRTPVAERRAAKPPVPKSRKQPRVTGAYNVAKGIKVQTLPVPKIGGFIWSAARQR